MSAAAVLKWLVLAALAAALVGGCWWAYESWRTNERNEAWSDGDKSGRQSVRSEWDEDIKRRDLEKLTDIAEARKMERQAAETAAQGERDARAKAETKLAAERVAAAAAAAGRDGLRDAAAALDRDARAIGIPDAAACPAEFVRQRDAAVRARSVLNACAARYVELAAATDGAITALTLKLDTAMLHIGVVHRLSPAVQQEPGPQVPSSP